MRTLTRIQVDDNSLYIPSRPSTNIDIGSPGAISLVFQALLPFLLFSRPSQSPSEPLNDDDPPSPIHLTIKGGTNVSFSPSVDYLKQVLVPTLTLIDIPPIDIKLHSRGWTTGTNEIGAITFVVQPFAPGTTLPAFSRTDRGEITSVNATVLAPRQAERDFQREIRAALSQTLPDVPVDVTFELSGHPKRLYLLLVVTTSTGCKLGRDWLYDRRITSLSAAVAQMVTKVVDELNQEVKSGAAVDEYMSDQLVVFQALASGSSVVNTGEDESGDRREGSLHAQTAWWVVQKLLGVDIGANGKCQGVGFVVRKTINSTSQNSANEIDGLEKEMDKLDIKKVNV